MASEATEKLPGISEFAASIWDLRTGIKKSLFVGERSGETAPAGRAAYLRQSRESLDGEGMFHDPRQKELADATKFVQL